MKLFISPHNDDETLFGSFTIMRERPLVVICTDSHVQVARGNPGCHWRQRRDETTAAIKELLGPAGPRENLKFFGIPDDSDGQTLVDQLTRKLCEMEADLAVPVIEKIWAPAFEPEGHLQHNAVAWVVDHLFRGKVPIEHYMTYTPAGKSTSSFRVPIQLSWAARKLKALACYTTQLDLNSTAPHFLREQYEYYQPIEPKASA